MRWILCIAVLCLAPASLEAQDRQVVKWSKSESVQEVGGPVFSGATDADRQIVREIRKAISKATDEELREANPEFWDNSWKPRRRLMRIAGSRRFLKGFKQDVSDEIVFNSEQEMAFGAIGDGAILDWLQNGGLDQILAFILALLEAFA